MGFILQPLNFHMKSELLKGFQSSETSESDSLFPSNVVGMIHKARIIWHLWQNVQQIRAKKTSEQHILKMNKERIQGI